MRVDKLRADELLNTLASMGAGIDQTLSDSYFELWGMLGYPRGTQPVAKESVVIKLINQWANKVLWPSTGFGLKVVDADMNRYAKGSDQHPVMKVDVEQPPQQPQESLYAQNKENAVDSEVLVPGYGRMSYKQLQNKIAEKLTELGNMLKTGDASSVKRVQYLIKNDPMLSMLNSLEDAFDELSAKRKRGGRGSRGIGTEFSESEMEERKLTGGEKRSREAHVKKLKKHKDDFEKRYGKDAESVMYAVATKRAKGESIGESEDRPYVCVHARKGKYECTAGSSYEAARKAMSHWNLKSTAGIDAYLADVEHVAESDNELEYNGKLHPSIDHTIEHDDPSFCYDCKLVSTTHGEIDTENDEADVVCPRCGSQAYVDASPEEIDQYASPEAWMSEADKDNKGFTDKQIKMAYGILNDPRYHQGNYSGAVNAIEKIAKGLSKHPSVANALMRANESTVKEEWDKPIDKAQFQANEAENMHTENAVALARRFGTPEEHQKMLDIYEAHMDRGWIEDDELEYRDSIIKKYYPMLENIDNALLRGPRGPETCVCKHCGCERDNPMPGCDCPCDSHDPQADHWIIIRTESEDEIYDSLIEKWSQSYKDSIDCNNPKGFSQKAHCAGRNK